MATVTGDIAIDYSGLADTNPYVHDSGVYTQNGPGFLISGGALKAISGFSFVNITEVPSGDQFSVEIEISTIPNFDPLYITAINSSGNGYAFSILSGTASYLYKITSFVLDGSITPNGGASADGDNFLMEVDKSAGTVTVSRNGTEVASYTGLVDYMSTDLLGGVAYARNNSGSSGISSWGATGYAAAGPSITDTTDPVVDGAESTITAEGLTGTPSATLGGYDLTLSGSLPNLTYTIDIAAITEDGPFDCPRIGDDLTLSLTGDEGTATSTVGTSPKAGWAVVELAGTLSEEANGLIDKIEAELPSVDVAVTNKILYPTADGTNITTTGFFTSSSFDPVPMILIQGGDATTAGNGYALSVLPPAADAPVDPGEFPISRAAVKAVTRSTTKSIYRG